MKDRRNAALAELSQHAHIYNTYRHKFTTQNLQHEYIHQNKLEIYVTDDSGVSHTPQISH